MFHWSAMLILKILKIVKQQHNSLEIKLIAEELFFDTQQNNWLGKLRAGYIIRGTQRQFSESISSEDDLRSRIFWTLV